MSAEAYWTLIERTAKGCYYLWGPIKNALMLELAEENNREGRDLILEICSSAPLLDPALDPNSIKAEIQLLNESKFKNRPLDSNGDEENHPGGKRKVRVMSKNRKDMLFQVLTITGIERKKQIQSLLGEISGWSHTLDQDKDNDHIREAKMLVADVASHLQYDALLCELLGDPDEEVRAYAVRATFRLWRREKAPEEEGDDILSPEEMVSIQVLKMLVALPGKLTDWLSSQARQRVQWRLQSGFSLTLSILFECYKVPAMTAMLQKVWADLVGQILWQTPKNAPGRASKESIKAYFRTRIITLLTEWALSFSKGMEGDSATVYDNAEIALFFQSEDNDLKAAFSRVVPYFDYRDHDIQDIADDLKTLALSRDMLSGYLFFAMLSTYMFVNPVTVTSLIESLFDDVIEVDDPALPAVGFMIMSLSSASDGKEKDEIDARILAIEKQAIIRYLKKHQSTSKGQIGNVRFLYNGLSSFPQYLYRKYGTVDRDLINAFIENAKQKDTYDRLYQYLINVVTSGPAITNTLFSKGGAIRESFQKSHVSASQPPAWESIFGLISCLIKKREKR